MTYDTPVELFDGFMECKVGDCAHVERYFHPAVGLMKISTHLEEEHDISEEELIKDLENLTPTNDERD